MRDASKAAGLRCIREFERINEVDFDPFDANHRFTISGMAPFGEAIRKVAGVNLA